MVTKCGNFQDFKELLLKSTEDSAIFLNGALKIRRTSYRGEFRIRGRVGRHIDFDESVEFLRVEHNMVIYGHYLNLE